MTTSAPGYRGRFAPSPTGPLHFGSLVAAVGSYLQARAAGGEWLVRVEDIDPPRESPGAADSILASLETFGLEWDGPVLFQSTRLAAYEAALEALLVAGLAYPCSCSRKDIERHNRQHPDARAGIYPGLCREDVQQPDDPTSVRLRTTASPVGFVDQIQGSYVQRLSRDVGDFILRRRDGLIAYQLAVVIDDAAQGITEVVRGCDLLDNTPRQIHLQQAMGLPTPRYAHLPIAINHQGEKLSKQTGATGLNPGQSGPILFETLRFLGMDPDAAMQHAPVADQLAWARTAWDPASLSGIGSRRIPPTIALAAAQ